MSLLSTCLTRNSPDQLTSLPKTPWSWPESAHSRHPFMRQHVIREQFCQERSRMVLNVRKDFLADQKRCQASAIDLFFFFFFFSVLSPARATVATGTLGTLMVSGTLDFFFFFLELLNGSAASSAAAATGSMAMSGSAASAPFSAAATDFFFFFFFFPSPSASAPTHMSGDALGGAHPVPSAGRHMSPFAACRHCFITLPWIISSWHPAVSGSC